MTESKSARQRRSAAIEAALRSAFRAVEDRPAPVTLTNHIDALSKAPGVRRDGRN